MYGLTELQLINNHPIAYEFVPNYRTRDRISSCNIKRTSQIMQQTAQLVEEPIEQILNEISHPPITNGEWEARQKAGVQ